MSVIVLYMLSVNSITWALVKLNLKLVMVEAYLSATVGPNISDFFLFLPSLAVRSPCVHPSKRINLQLWMLMKDSLWINKDKTIAFIYLSKFF